MGQRARDRVAEELRQMIVTGELAPGRVVSEADLCDLLGCSRTPLREALYTLSLEYMVRLPHRRGILIPELGIADFRDLHQSMVLLYGSLVEPAVEGMGADRIEAMEYVLAEQARCAAESDFYGLTSLDGRFHLLIAEATGNRYLVDAVDRIHRPISRFIHRAYVEGGSSVASIAEHREIIRAFKRSDSELVKTTLRDHSVAATRRIWSILARQPSGSRGELDPDQRESEIASGGFP
jgi:DNA-binding GntR family transcriptional regulator